MFIWLSRTWIETFVDFRLDRIIFYSISFRLWTIRSIKSSYDMKSCQSCWSVNTWQCKLNNEILCCRLWSWVNSIIALKNCVESNDVIVKCADFQYRRCYFILIDFICDYEKKMIITDVKTISTALFVKYRQKSERISTINDYFVRTKQLNFTFVDSVSKTSSKQTINEFMMSNVLFKNMISWTFTKSWWLIFFINYWRTWWCTS